MKKSDKKILVIDPEGDFVGTLTMRLEHEGYQVAYAERVDQGLEMSRFFKPDCILLDPFRWDGQEMGWERCRSLCEHPRIVGTPVIVVTGGMIQETATQARRAGASASFMKPCDMGTLSLILEDTLTASDSSVQEMID